MLLNLERRRKCLNIQELRLHSDKNYEGEKVFTKTENDNIYSYEKSSTEEVICFLFFVSFTVYVFSLDFWH